MHDTMLVRLTPWAIERIRKDHNGGRAKITKKALRESLAAFPGTEFHTIATPDQPRGGTVITVREAWQVGVRTLEVRLNGDVDLAVVVIGDAPDKVVVA